MALENVKVKYIGTCHVDIVLYDQHYPCIKFGVLENLCSDVILGYEFQRQQKNVIFEYHGNRVDLVVYSSDQINKSCALLPAK